jgi:hypothetical protein
VANAIVKDACYIDTAAVGITFDAVVPLVYGLLITPTSANARITLKSVNTSGTIWVDLKAESANESRYVTWDSENMKGLRIYQTIYVATLTNCVAVLYGDFALKAGTAQ